MKDVLRLLKLGDTLDHRGATTGIAKESTLDNKKETSKSEKKDPEFIYQYILIDTCIPYVHRVRYDGLNKNWRTSELTFKVL